MSVSFDVGNRRLLKLADFLRTIPSERFYYGAWSVSDVGPEEWKKGEKKLTCGTAACALGWATAIPTFKRAGLKLVPGLVKLDHKDGTCESGFDAGASFFGITLEESDYLFSPSDGEGNSTPKQVACKIEKFVKNRIQENKKQQKAA